MIRFIKTTYLLFYFIISLFFMEIILRVSTEEGLFSQGLAFSLVFLVSFAIIFYIICSLFEGKLNYVLSVLLLVFSAFIFSSQLTYFKIFKTFYSLYSAGNSAQVFEFWRDICSAMVKNLAWIVLFFLPAILLIFLKKKASFFKKINWAYRISLVLCIALFHLMGVASAYFGSRELNSAYDLYFKSSSPVLSVEKLGLLTTMRLDLQRLISGWSPALEEEFIGEDVAAEGEEAEAGEDPNALPTFSDGKPGENNPEETDTIEEEPVSEEKEIEYNTMDIDFSKLISNEKNQVLKNMHKYFDKVQPTAKNEYTGKYKGYNLIFLTAEGFSPYAVREDVTPTLYKLVNEGFNFTNFYNPIWGVSTSDGEYVACTGLIPKSGIWSFKKSGSNYLPFVMGNQLKKLDYKTMAYHNHTYTYYGRNISHPNMGYDYKAVGKGLNVKKTWPESDLEMMEKTVPEYVNDQPFHAYYMTVSGHMQYNFSGNLMAIKNKDAVKDLPYSEAGRAYIATQIELDKALESLLKQLEEAGIADKTLIALSADHYPYGLENEQIDELAGHRVERDFELYKSTFILYTKGMEPTTIDKPCSSLDIIPTLSNLLGLEYDSRLLMGRDIFSDSEPLVMFVNKSFITDKGRYNSKNGKFIPNEGVEVEEDYVKKTSSLVNSKFYYSAKILENNYYKKVLKD
jgi:lipoteichoic acid synthase